MRRPAVTAFLLLLPVFAAAQVAPGPNANPRAVWSSPPERITTRVVAAGFEDPWEVTYGPDGWLWITERVGKRVVRVICTDPRHKQRQG